MVRYRYIGLSELVIKDQAVFKSYKYGQLIEEAHQEYVLFHYASLVEPVRVGDVGPTGPQGNVGLEGYVGDIGPTGLPSSLKILGPTGYDGVGLRGLTGARGFQGKTGVSLSGPTGNQGLTGDVGLTGPIGETGLTGFTGLFGRKGLTGLVGPSGAQGESLTVIPDNLDDYVGIIGSQGPIGYIGNIGPTGPKGILGDQGHVGHIGITGVAGFTGPTGEQGLVGPTGFSGPQGTVGVTGEDGGVGPQGLSGLVGYQGFQGHQGIQGDLGPQGPKGLTGYAGVTGFIGLRGITGPTQYTSVYYTTLDIKSSIVLVNNTGNFTFSNGIFTYIVIGSEMFVYVYLTIETTNGSFSEFYVNLPLSLISSNLITNKLSYVPLNSQSVSTLRGVPTIRYGISDPLCKIHRLNNALRLEVTTPTGIGDDISIMQLWMSGVIPVGLV